MLPLDHGDLQKLSATILNDLRTTTFALSSTQLHYVRCLTASATWWPAVVDKGCSEVIYATVYALPNGLTATPYWLERPMRIRSVQNTATHLVSGAIGATTTLRLFYAASMDPCRFRSELFSKQLSLCRNASTALFRHQRQGALRPSGKCPRSFTATVCIDWTLASSLDQLPSNVNQMWTGYTAVWNGLSPGLRDNSLLLNTFKQKRNFSDSDERHPALLWRLCDSSAVIQVSRFTYLLTFQFLGDRYK